MENSRLGNKKKSLVYTYKLDKVCIDSIHRQPTEGTSRSGKKKVGVMFFIIKTDPQFDEQKNCGQADDQKKKEFSRLRQKLHVIPILDMFSHLG